MNKQEQMLKILKDTRDYYAEDPYARRSLDGDSNCNYTWGNTHCAVGRYLKPEYQKEQWSCNNDSVNQLCEEKAHTIEPHGWNIDWALREEVHGLCPNFWMRLQDFHDNRHNWDQHGTTDFGRDEYLQIEDRIVRGLYDE